LRIPVCRKELLARASIIKYRNTNKPCSLLHTQLCCVCYTSKEQYEKYLCNPSSHNRKYREYTCETHTPRLIIGKPVSQYASYSAMFCPLHSNLDKEQHDKYLCNPTSHYSNYGEYTRETHAPYLNT